MMRPLEGLRIVEFAGLGPTPFAAMLLSDFGADVIRIERPGARALIPQELDFLEHGRNAIRLNLKDQNGREAALALAARADGLIEGMRPGVMERLGLGPDPLLNANPALVYGRMTGWGQTGPRAAEAGHDINYLAATGMLHAFGGEHPEIPLNLLGDFGGGGMYLAFGMLAALMHVRGGGEGQVVDAAIVDGVSHLATMIWSLRNSGMWRDTRRSNLLDGGAPFYRVYQCRCGGHVAVGAIEPQFWRELITGLSLDAAGLPDRDDPSNWPLLHKLLGARFLEEDRDSWAAKFGGSDACVTPVLSMREAQLDSHMTERGLSGALGPKPAPALSKTPGDKANAGGELTLDEALVRWSAQP